MALGLALGILLGVLAVVGLWVLFQYNRMVTLRNRVKESWGNVETELQRWHDLVPNLVEAAKGAAKQERTVVDSVTKARAAALTAPRSPQAEAGLVRALDRLLALAEAYPRLASSRNFLQLQEELAITEDRIAAARRFHNGNVRNYLDQIRQMPGNLVARTFRFQELPYYEVAEVNVRRVPQVAV